MTIPPSNNSNTTTAVFEIAENPVADADREKMDIVVARALQELEQVKEELKQVKEELRKEKVKNDELDYQLYQEMVRNDTSNDDTFRMMSQALFAADRQQAIDHEQRLAENNRKWQEKYNNKRT